VTSRRPGRRPTRGTVEWPPSGSARLRVYAGVDQLTGKKLLLRETVYAQLRRCRDHCRGQAFVQDRTAGEHVCDEHSARRKCARVVSGSPEALCRYCDRACRPHRCTPLAADSIRVVHAILSGAFSGPSAGAGSRSARSTRPNRHRLRARIRTRPLRTKRRSSSPRHGRTRSGACSSGRPGPAAGRRATCAGTGLT